MKKITLHELQDLNRLTTAAYLAYRRQEIGTMEWLAAQVRWLDAHNTFWNAYCEYARQNGEEMPIIPQIVETMEVSNAVN